MSFQYLYIERLKVNYQVLKSCSQQLDFHKALVQFTFTKTECHIQYKNFIEGLAHVLLNDLRLRK